MSNAAAGPAGHGPGATPHPRAARLAVLAGSSTVLVLATLLGSALALTNKWACRAGAWNGYLTQFQAHCYTDIYPLYYGEKLSAGQVPYLGHPVEYPVLIGGAMQLAAWVVRPISDPFTQGREFFDVTILLLTLFAIAGVLATAYLAGRARRWTALGVALAPAVILGEFINWDLIAMGLVMLGMAAWAAGAACWLACSSGWRWRPSSTRCSSSARCCCSACGPAGCASSGSRSARPRPPGWW